MPIQYHGLEACPINKSIKNSLSYVLNTSLRKLKLNQACEKDERQFGQAALEADSGLPASEKDDGRQPVERRTTCTAAARDNATAPADDITHTPLVGGVKDVLFLALDWQRIGQRLFRPCQCQWHTCQCQRQINIYIAPIIEGRI